MVSKGLSFLAFVYLARILGVTNFGVLEFAGSILTYLLLLADGGLELWGTREASKTKDLLDLAARVLPIRLLLACASFGALLLLLPCFPPYPKLRLVLTLYGLTVFAQAINLKWTFMGQQNMMRAARGLVIGQMVFAATVFLFIHSAAGLVLVPVLRLAGDLSATVYFGQWFRRTHGSLPLDWTLRGMGVALKPAFTIGLSQAMGLLNYNFDAVLLGFLRGAAIVAWYNAAYKLILVGMSFPIAYFAGLFPALSRHYFEDHENFRMLVRRTSDLWFLFTVPLVVGGTFLAKPLISFLYGSAYLNSSVPFQILLWSATMVVLRWVYMDSLRATGHQALDLRCAVTSACLNVGLNVLLIPRYGMVGAASATTFADLVWFAMSIYYFRRAVLSGGSFITVKAPLLGGAAMALVLWFTRTMNWSARAVLGIFIYLAIQAVCGSLSLRLFYEETSEK